jgi:predicted membrane protein
VNSGPKRSNGAMLAGVIIMAVGTVLLLNQFDLLPHRFVPNFWPVVLVVVGLIKALSGNDRGDRVVGGCLIAAGSILQTNALGMTHITWNEAWPLFIIVVGIMLIVHAMSDKPGWNPKFTTAPELNSFYVFGGGERRVTAKDFRGARLFAVFGGYEVDLLQADMAGNEAYIEANAVFGGGEIRVPTNWKVVVQGVGIFGGYDDKTQHVQTDPAVPSKTLHIRGVAVFGGIEVKN